MANSSNRSDQNIGTPRARRQLSPRALATASLTAATRLTGEARREALAEHARLIGWAGQSCPMRRPAR